MTAYNAGLKVVGYSANGTLEINMIVPLVHGSEDSHYGTFSSVDFGTDNATQAFIARNGNSGSLQLQNLGGEQATVINTNIIHEGTVSSWTVTPVWTNSP